MKSFSKQFLSLCIAAISVPALAQTSPYWDYTPGQYYYSGDIALTAGRHATYIGQRDQNGYAWSQIFATEKTLYGFSSDSNLNGKILAPAGNDVLNAHRNGWTGQGVDIVVLDSFSLTNEEYARGKIAHGDVVTATIARTAPGATITGIEYFNDATLGSTNSIELNPIGTNAFSVNPVDTSNRYVNVGVINLSFGSSYPQILSPRAALANNADVINLVNASNYGASLADAVITKAAGNDGLSAQHDSLNVALMTSGNTVSRTILVGSTNGNGSVNNPTTLASYSNTCGNYCNRYVTANGNDPFINYESSGTSNAAPLVAGYAAIVRQKFETVSGAQAADIILRTARTDTINNYNYNIHGRGEASLSRALSPIGKLR